MSLPSPSPLRHAREGVHAVQKGLLAWAKGKLAEAGAEDVEVSLAGGSGPDSGPCLWLLPVRVAVPGRSGDLQGVPLLVPADLARDTAPATPAWAELARAMQAAVDLVFPRPDARPGPASRPRPSPAVDTLPAALGAWYRERGDDTWTRPEDGLLARPPTLTWRPAVALRLHYVALLQGAGADTLPLLAALTAAVTYDNSFAVRAPSAAADPLLVSFARALAESVGGPAADELRAALAGLDEDPEQVVSVSPSTELTLAQVHQLAASADRGMGPHVQLSVGLSAGAVAIFAPAAAPTLAARPRRAGDPE